MSKPLSFQVFMSFSAADWRTELKRKLVKGVALFCPTSDAEFVTFHIGQYGGMLINVQLFRGQLFTDRSCNTHVCSPLSAFLGYEFVRHKVVRCSECLSVSCLMGTMVPIKHGA